MQRQILIAKSGISNHASYGMEEIREFCFKDLPPSVYSGTFLFSGISVILLITPKRITLIAAISFNNRYQASDRNTPKSDKPPQNCAPDSCRQSGLC